MGIILVSEVTGCPSPDTCFSLLGLLSPISFVKLFEQQVGIFPGPLYLLLASPTHTCLLLLFDLLPPELESVCLPLTQSCFLQD